MTSQSNRTYITLLGKCNSGKSSLLNALTRQELAIVSELAGTTTDPVSKSIEIPGIGSCLLIDTAGFNDTGGLSKKRLQKTQKMLLKTDLAIMVYRDADVTEELQWVERLTRQNISIIHVINEGGLPDSTWQMAKQIKDSTNSSPVVVNAQTGEHIEKLLKKITAFQQENHPVSITGNLIKPGDVVLLVMPQDIQAPRGRLILPQSQTIRELLDKQCITVACATEQLKSALASLSSPPALIITDSQVLPEVKKQVSDSCKVTTFSILFAGYKGDIRLFTEGAKAIDRLTPQSRILIAEACTHAPLSEDIGREKIPRMLRKRIGENLHIDIVSGSDFPADISKYNLVIHCGACMFNRKHVLMRIKHAVEQDVPITNYGIAIAYLSGMLGEVVMPEEI